MEILKNFQTNYMRCNLHNAEGDTRHNIPDRRLHLTSPFSQPFFLFHESNWALSRLKYTFLGGSSENLNDTSPRRKILTALW